MVWITYRLRQENYKKKVKMEMRKEGKEVAFQDGTYSFFSKLYTFNMFLLEIHKIIFYKKQF